MRITLVLGRAVYCMVRAMELRRRRGDAGNGPRCGNVEVSVAGTIRGNDRVSPSLKRPTADCFDNGGFTPSSSEAADAVVGAAVRGGSLLIVLALIQVWARELGVKPAKLY